MGMPAILTRNGTGTTAIWQPDWMQNPFVVGCGIVPAGATATVEATYDNPATVTSPTWFTVVALTGINASATFTSPVQGFRLNVATALSTGVITATFVQATFGG